MKEAFLVAGRSVDDYIAKGATPERDLSWVECIACKKTIGISKEAADRLARAPLEGYHPAGAICTPCLMRFRDQMRPGQMTVATSKKGEEQLQRRTDAQKFMESLIRRGAKKI